MYADNNLGIFGIGRKLKKAAKKLDPKKLGQKLEDEGKKALGRALSILSPPLTQPPLPAEIPQQEPQQDFIRTVANSPYTIPALVGVGILLYLINRK